MSYFILYCKNYKSKKYTLFILLYLVYDILVKKYFVTLQLLSISLAEDLKLNRLNRHNYINRNSLVATTARSPGKHYDASFYYDTKESD